VTLRDVVETVDGRLASMDGERPGIDGVWQQARALLVGLLGDLTITDMVDEEERLSETPMFYI
jgi:DNA-binding IscR family transcriptional regulator